MNQPLADAHSKLQDPNVTIRMQAVDEIEIVPPHYMDNIPVLIKDLKSLNSQRRESAAEYLGGKGLEAKEAIPALIEAMDDEVEHNRAKIAEALGKMGPAAKDAVPKLIDAILAEYKQYQWVPSYAALALGNIGAEAKEAVPALIQVLREKRANCNTEAVLALGKIGVTSDDVNAILNKVLNDEVDFLIRFYAHYSLVLLGFQSEDHIYNFLRQTFENPDPNVRRDAGERLTDFCIDKETLGEESCYLIPFLIQAMKDENEDVRHYAVCACRPIKSNNPEFIQALIERLDDPVMHIRNNAADMLASIGPEAEAAAPAMLRLLQDPENDQRYMVSYALQRIQAKPEVVVPVLVNNFIRNKDNSIWNSLIHYGKSLKPYIPQFISILESEDRKRWRSAACILGAIGPDAKDAIPALIRALNNEDKWIRRDMAQALGNIGPAAAQAIPALIKLLNDEDEHVRNQVAASLGKMGEKAESAVPALIELLKDDVENVRMAAITALAEVGEKAQQALPALYKSLEDKENSIRHAAARTIAKIAPVEPDKITKVISALEDQDITYLKIVMNIGGKDYHGAGEAVPVLIDLLNHEDQNAVKYASIRLAIFEGESREGIPVFLDMLNSPDKLSKRKALQIFYIFNRYIFEDDQDVISALAQTLENPDPEIRIQTLKVLTELGPKAKAAIPNIFSAFIDPNMNIRFAADNALRAMGKEAVPFLMKVLLNDNEVLRCFAAGALGLIGPDAKEAVPTLTVLMQDSRPRVRKAAVSALGLIGSEAQTAIPTLIAGLGDPEWEVRDGSVRTLRLIGEPAISALVKALTHEQPKIRMNAAVSLGNMGYPAKDTLPALEELANDPDPEVSQRAQTAVIQIKNALSPPSEYGEVGLLSQEEINALLLGGMADE